MKEVIVTGGRNYNNLNLLSKVLDFIKPKRIIQGGATGADFLARQWCKSNWILPITVYADWTRFGKAAGPIRNVEMIEKFPNAIIVAFPGGDGTKNCIKEALKRNRIVIEVKE